MATKGLKFFHVSTFPTTGQVEGGIYFKAATAGDDAELRIWNGIAWENYSGLTDAQYNDAAGKLYLYKGGETRPYLTLDFSSLATKTYVDTQDATTLKSAKDYADAEIQKLDAEISNTVGADGLALSIKEVDGKITEISGSIAANTYDAYGAAASAETNAKTYADGLKTAIDAYTVNGKAINGSPVLNGGDIKLDGYEEYTDMDTDIEATDTVNVAFSKLEKRLDDVGGDALTSVVAGNGIAVTEKVNHQQTISAKVYSEASEKYLKNGENGLYVDGIDAAISNEIAKLNKSDAAVAGQLVSAVSEEDGVITVARRYLAATDIKLEKLASPSETTLAAEYKLVNAEGTVLGDTIKIAKDQFLKEVHFYKQQSDVPSGVTVPTGTEFPVIRFIFTTAAGDTESWVSVKDLVDTYTASNGVKLEGNDFQGVVDPDSEYLTVGEDGFKVSGVDAAIATAKDALDVRIKVFETGGAHDVAALEGDVDTLEGRVTTAESDIDALEGRVTTAESDIDDLQADSHTHDNKEVLDGITSAVVAVWDAAEANAKAYTDVEIQKLDANISLDGSNGLSLSITETDGKLDSISGELMWSAW